MIFRSSSVMISKRTLVLFMSLVCTFTGLILLKDIDVLYSVTTIVTSSKDVVRTDILIHSNSMDFDAYKHKKLFRNNFNESELLHKYNVSSNGSDVINFMRIQKTGSTTMDDHLIHDLDLSRWCDCAGKKRAQCDCARKWNSKVLFKQDKNHWPCGVHPDWTYLQVCRRNPKQRNLLLTVLRDPIKRYLSEWRHVRLGYTWDGQALICGGKDATKKQVRPCYRTQNWKDVSLEQFMDCPSNLGVNRQTRMMADLALVNCYNTSGMTYDERYEIMLDSAKRNLKHMPFFGITDYQSLTQILFENTFDLSFNVKFVELPQVAESIELSNDTLNRILEMNRYDVMLYQFAKDLFIQRMQLVAKSTNDESIRVKINTYDFLNMYV